MAVISGFTTTQNLALQFTFVSELGKSHNVYVYNPKSIEDGEITESQLEAAAKAMIESQVFRIDGTFDVTCKEIKYVDKTTITMDEVDVVVS